MFSSPAVNAGASSPALQLQAQDNQQATPASIQQGSLAGRSVIRQEATGESCPQMPKHNAPTILPENVTAFLSRQPRLIRALQSTGMIKDQASRHVQALVSCLRANVGPKICYDLIKEMCRPVSRVASAKPVWQIKNLIEAAEKLYPELKIESANDLKKDATALVTSLSEKFGKATILVSWETILDTAYTGIEPTGRIILDNIYSDTQPENEDEINDEGTAASTKMLERMAFAHVLHAAASSEFGQDSADMVMDYLYGEYDLNFKKIWELDLDIKEQLYKETNPEKYFESYIKYHVKLTEEKIKNGVPRPQCNEYLENKFAMFKSPVSQDKQPNSEQWQLSKVSEEIDWNKINGYITSMPNFKQHGNIPPSAKAIVDRIFYSPSMQEAIGSGDRNGGAHQSSRNSRSMPSSNDGGDYTENQSGSSYSDDISS